MNIRFALSKNVTLALVTLLLLTIVLPSCRKYYFRSVYQNANHLLMASDPENRPFLKAHMRNGDVLVFGQYWAIDTAQQIVKGSGKHYNANRRLLTNGFLSAHLDSVALFETNRQFDTMPGGYNGPLIAMAVMDAAVIGFCMANPKACYGSCPTFYSDPNSQLHYSNAEGFSNAVLPSLEYEDIDDLLLTTADKKFHLYMKNEAFETHYVRYAKLDAIPVPLSGRIYHGVDDDYYECGSPITLSKAEAASGDVTGVLGQLDRVELSSLADSINMASKEDVILEFSSLNASTNYGLNLGFRHSLMSTYLIYSVMGYMGDEAGEITARMETTDSMSQLLNNGLHKLLGGIEVYCYDPAVDDWAFQGVFDEPGPIALNNQLLPLSAKGSTLRFKLVLNKGLWRMDHAQLCPIVGKVKPFVLEPEALYRLGQPDSHGLWQLLDPDEHLVSLPGDLFTLVYDLPDGHESYQLFLRSKGYYFEWMRPNWFKDKDLLKLHQMVYNPKRYLRSEAENYKRYEAEMEAMFWNSRVETKSR